MENLLAVVNPALPMTFFAHGRFCSATLSKCLISGYVHTGLLLGPIQINFNYKYVRQIHALFNI